MKKKNLIVLSVLFLFIIAGCGAETKYDFKLEDISLRNIRNKSFAVELKFNRTVRSITKDDAIKLEVEVFPNEGDSLEVKKENIIGMLLEDMIILPYVDSFKPEDYYKAKIILSRKNKIITSGYFIFENGKAKKVEKADYEEAEAPVVEGEEETEDN